ncbi:putative formate transporter [Beauveria bassiana]|uniref:Putative formate transporter n=1 Tax=Beauveria bassiana TaxID=176275 RepID=A0A2N6NCH8_BEABA|nr:putative formate transporter [Beauveria bassiana]
MDAFIVNAYTPMETTEICSRVGTEKANMRVDKIFISAVVAGCYIAFSSSVCLVINTSPGYTTLAALHRRISTRQMLMHWALTFFGNLAGSLFIVGIIGYGGVLDNELYRDQAIEFADESAYTPMWHQIFLRAICANWLVSLACWLAFQARDVAGKIAAIWWPVFAFVALGLDHVVANMCFIPTAILLGSPHISVSYYIWKSMTPALLGNIVGGGLCVATLHWYLVGNFAFEILTLKSSI